VESLIAADDDYRATNDEQRNFDFLRFKYRILSLTQKSSTARGYLASELSDPRATEFERNMALYGLSQIDQRTNNYEQSLARIDEVIASFPDKQILRVDKAVILSDQGQYLEARILLEQVRRREPNNSYVLYNLGKVAAKLGDADLAVDLFKEVAYNIPEFSEVYFEIGKILSGQGKHIDARFYLGKYNLYEGKLKLAEANFKQVADKTEEQSELGKKSREMLALIERLKKK
jgi:predicted Zn-dependent protease